MKNFLRKLRAWYQRRFRGYVAARTGVGGRGTARQEHKRESNVFLCLCGKTWIEFTDVELFVRQREHNHVCKDQA